MTGRIKGVWTSAEEDALLDMFAKGAATKEVAAALGRSQEAISSRRLRLGKQTKAQTLTS